MSGRARTGTLDAAAMRNVEERNVAGAFGEDTMEGFKPNSNPLDPIQRAKKEAADGIVELARPENQKALAEAGNGTAARIIAVASASHNPDARKPVKRSQTFDDGSVLSTRHDGSTFARPASPAIEALRANPHFPMRTVELETGETRILGPSNTKWTGVVKPDGTFVLKQVSAPEDQGGAGGGKRSIDPKTDLPKQPNPKEGWDGLWRALSTFGGSRS